MLQDYNKYPAFYRDPECPKDYSAEAWIDGEWRELLRINGNYHRHVRHRLEEPVITGRLRITFHATNGSPSAAVYEIRCYTE